MKRRTFLTSTLATAAAGTVPAVSHSEAPQGGAATGRLFYELRRYQLSSGPQRKLCNDFFADALIPAVNRLGISPVGVFDLTIGPRTPALYVLLPGASLETLATLEARLAQDSEYLKAGAPFLNAPAVGPPFARMESSLMHAFAKIPGITLPKATATKGARIFEIRTYESATDQDHKRKVEMMQAGEQDIFEKAGFEQVFYGDTLIGGLLPNLTYMLSFPNLTERDKCWAAFRDAPAWKAMTGDPRYSFEEIVSNITSIILSPTPYSQI
jgi:hypothetical protein